MGQSSWLTDLAVEIEAVDEGDLIEPPEEYDPVTERVLDEMTPWQRKAFTLHVLTHRRREELATLLEQLHAAGRHEEEAKVADEATPVVIRDKVLGLALFEDIYFHFGLSPNTPMGLRKGFLVVSVDVDPNKLEEVGCEICPNLYLCGDSEEPEGGDPVVEIFGINPWLYLSDGY